MDPLPIKKRKLNNIKLDDYMDIDLNQYKRDLIDKKYEYQMKIKRMDQLINETNNLIAKKCKKNNKEHKWVTEREPCMYGEKYTYCQNCKVDLYDNNQFHL